MTEQEAKTCPNCGRKLLTQLSALCNWCGTKIDDPEYQERAAQIRHERDEADRIAVENVRQEEARHGGPLGRLKHRNKQGAILPGAMRELEP